MKTGHIQYIPYQRSRVGEPSLFGLFLGLLGLAGFFLVVAVGVFTLGNWVIDWLRSLR